MGAADDVGKDVADDVDQDHQDDDHAPQAEDLPGQEGTGLVKLVEFEAEVGQDKDVAGEGNGDAFLFIRHANLRSLIVFTLCKIYIT